MNSGKRHEQLHSERGEEGHCVFCAIVAETEPASVIYDDPEVRAFLDIRPINAGHLLIIPKRHATYLADLDEATGALMFRVAMRLAETLRASGLRCEGINLFLADGEAAGQEVFHVHLHVFPRFAGDGFRIEEDWPEPPPRTELDAVAAQLRDSFEALQFGPI
jgi:histidine triad (HIT) family protein